MPFVDFMSTRSGLCMDPKKMARLKPQGMFSDFNFMGAFLWSVPCLNLDINAEPGPVDYAEGIFVPNAMSRGDLDYTGPQPSPKPRRYCLNCRRPSAQNAAFALFFSLFLCLQLVGVRKMKWHGKTWPVPQSGLTMGQRN